MKYISQLSVKEINDILNKLGYILIDDNNDKTKNKACSTWNSLEEDKECLLKCFKPHNESVDAESLSLLRSLFNTEINTGLFDAEGKLLRLNDFSICEAFSLSLDLTNSFRKIMQAKFGKEYEKDLQSFIQQKEEQHKITHNLLNEEF